MIRKELLFFAEGNLEIYAFLQGAKACIDLNISTVACASYEDIGLIGESANTRETSTNFASTDMVTPMQAAPCGADIFSLGI